MIQQEVDCFVEVLGCSPRQLDVFSLLDRSPPQTLFDQVDMVLLGGSGDHSVAEGGQWVPHVQETMRSLVHQAKPTFASCWGFQAMAQALGGHVVTDIQQAELGSINLRLTRAGVDDPVFGHMPKTFCGQAGHQDVVMRLPESSQLLASSDLVQNQAFRFVDKPIYCTQFHPELSRTRLRQRLVAYPQYIERISGMSLEDFFDNVVETPETARILNRFLQCCFS